MVSLIESAQQDGSEVDGPESISLLFEAHGLAFEDLGDDDALAVPANDAIVIDHATLEMRRVLDIRELPRVRARRRAVDMSRGGAGVGFVRTGLVVLLAEAVEGALLGPWCTGGGPSGEVFEGAEKALVAGIVLRMTGERELGRDAQLDPPDVQARQAPHRQAGEGRAVVGADGLGQPKIAEEERQDPPPGHVGGAVPGLAGQPEA